MATSSFTKNFKVSKHEAQKFVENVTVKAPKKQETFQSKFTHHNNNKSLLLKALS